MFLLSSEKKWNEKKGLVEALFYTFSSQLYEAINTVAVFHFLVSTLQNKKKLGALIATRN